MSSQPNPQAPSEARKRSVSSDKPLGQETESPCAKKTRQDPGLMEQDIKILSEDHALISSSEDDEHDYTPQSKSKRSPRPTESPTTRSISKRHDPILISTGFSTTKEICESDDEGDSFLEEPFSHEEAEALILRAREIGYQKFLEEHLELKTNVLKLFHAFDFEFPADGISLPEDIQWALFAGELRRFCQIRFCNPNIHSIEHAVDLIRNAKKILLLTGAGISVSCGIPDFRSEKGLYSIIAEQFPELGDPQAMFDIHYFKHDPRPFFTLAKEIYPSNFKPSPTHCFIRLLQDRGVLLRDYTQNIDTLEKTTGIQQVVHCHGSFDTATCQRCGTQVDGDSIRVHIFNNRIPMCPICNKDQPCPEIDTFVMPEPDDNDSDAPSTEPVPILKPDIVFFGEKLPDEFDRMIELDRQEADLMIVIGSSLKVAPVSELVGFVPHHVPLLLINREPVNHLHHSFDVQLLGFCDVIVQDLCARLGWTLPLQDAKVSDNAIVEDANACEKPKVYLERVDPNIYLYEGHVFNRERHARILAGQDYYATTTEDDSSQQDDGDLSEMSSEDEATQEEDETEELRQANGNSHYKFE